MHQLKEKTADALQGIDGNETESNTHEGTARMTSATILPATIVTDQSDLDNWDQTFPCESFDWCEGHDAGELNHKPDEMMHNGEDKTLWRQTTEGHMEDFDVLAQRMRIGLNGADTIAVSFQIDGRLNTLELPGFALALESMAAKFRTIAAEIS